MRWMLRLPSSQQIALLSVERADLLADRARDPVRRDMVPNVLTEFRVLLEPGWFYEEL